MPEEIRRKRRVVVNVPPRSSTQHTCGKFQTFEVRLALASIFVDSFFTYFRDTRFSPGHRSGASPLAQFDQFFLQSREHANADSNAYASVDTNPAAAGRDCVHGAEFRFVRRDSGAPDAYV